MISNCDYLLSLVTLITTGDNLFEMVLWRWKGAYGNNCHDLIKLLTVISICDNLLNLLEMITNGDNLLEMVVR